MPTIIKERITAETDENFVVFLIGMRINAWWKIHKWLPIAISMTKMLKELYRKPQLGLISHEQWFGRTTMMIQYWKSFDQLEAYAKSRDTEHLPAWAAFNKKVSNNGDVGIWHETYLISPQDYECIYNNMPAFGLAKAMKIVPAKGKYKSARERVKAK